MVFNQHLFEISLYDSTEKRELPLFHHHDGCKYVPGNPGNRYWIILKNLTDERLMAVLSVDGINTISGETAGSDQRGYVIAPRGKAEVKGWRKSMQESAEFYFTKIPDSYASKTGRPDNVGVIGLAVFREKLPPPIPFGIPISSKTFVFGANQPVFGAPAPSPFGAVPAFGAPTTPLRAFGAPPSACFGATPSAGAFGAPPSASACFGGPAPSAGAFGGPACAFGAMPAPSFGGAFGAPAESSVKLGTGHGDRRWDPVNNVKFERRNSHPDDIITLYYDSVQSLIMRGIIPYYNRQPNPFPKGFCPDP